MGKLLVTYKGKTHEYLINTQVEPHAVDSAVEMILKAFPLMYLLISRNVVIIRYK